MRPPIGPTDSRPGFSRKQELRFHPMPDTLQTISDGL